MVLRLRQFELELRQRTVNGTLNAEMLNFTA